MQEHDAPRRTEQEFDRLFRLQRLASSAIRRAQSQLGKGRPDFSLEALVGAIGPLEELANAMPRDEGQPEPLRRFPNDAL